MFRLKCGGLRHVVRAMLTANVRSQKLKKNKVSMKIIVLTHFVFTDNLVENYDIPRFRFTATGTDPERTDCARFSRQNTTCAVAT